MFFMFPFVGTHVHGMPIKKERRCALCVHYLYIRYYLLSHNYVSQLPSGRYYFVHHYSIHFVVAPFAFALVAPVVPQHGV